MARAPSYLNFDRSAYYFKKDTDYKLHPEQYRVGKGEQGVLICEPYKSELLPLWRFKTGTIARKSSNQLFERFLKYLDDSDLPGADMARKFLQMGFTRARRYANYKGGKKYDRANAFKELPRGTGDPEKAKAAELFYAAWKNAEAEARYKKLKTAWKKKYG